jgi:hypothetical protein
MYEAAEMDGASPFQKFWYLSLPQLLGILSVLFLLRFIWTFNKFDDIFLLTGGNAGTRTLTVNVYEQAFALSNIGAGAAVAVVIFACLLLFSFCLLPLHEPGGGAVSALRHAALTAAALGALWAVVAATTVPRRGAELRDAALACRPALWALGFGALTGLVTLYLPGSAGSLRAWPRWLAFGRVLAGTPVLTAKRRGRSARRGAWPGPGHRPAGPRDAGELPRGRLTRHEFEDRGDPVPDGVRLSLLCRHRADPVLRDGDDLLKTQQALLQNPLDFSIDLSQGGSCSAATRNCSAISISAAYMWTRSTSRC